MSNGPRDDGFFIGWADRPPPRASARASTRACLSLVALALCVNLATALLSRPPGDGRWDTDTPRHWNGRLHLTPYAMLELDGPGGPKSALLVEQGKFSAQGRAAPFDGRVVNVTGTSIERSGHLVIELAAGDEAMVARADDLPGPAGGPAARTTDAVDLGPVVLRGEILDSKCHLGAMRPGDGKTHKACATLCIDGGVPPLLITRRNDVLEYVLLVAPDGGPANSLVRELVGEPVELTGRLSRWRELLSLRLEPDGLRRLGPAD